MTVNANINTSPELKHIAYSGPVIIYQYTGTFRADQGVKQLTKFYLRVYHTSNGLWYAELGIRHDDTPNMSIISAHGFYPSIDELMADMVEHGIDITSLECIGHDPVDESLATMEYMQEANFTLLFSDNKSF